MVDSTDPVETEGQDAELTNVPSARRGSEGGLDDDNDNEEEEEEEEETEEEEEEEEEEFAYDDEALSPAWLYDEEQETSENTVMQPAPRWNISPYNVPEYCTLNRLVIKLTEPNIPQSHYYFVHAFLCTYRNFVSPSIFLAKLFQRYFIPPPSNNPLALDLNHWEVFQKVPVQRSVCSVLISWLESYAVDFSRRMLSQVEEFVYEHLGVGMREGDFELSEHNMRDGHHALGMRILSLLDHVRDVRDPDIRKKSLARSGSLAPVEGRLSFTSRRSTVFESKEEGDKLNVHDYPETEIANQLTDIQALDYNNISARELLVAGRNDKRERLLQPHILRQVARFNNVSAWVAESVIAGATVQQRVQVITRFIAIMDRLLHLHNYNSLAAIYGGLNNPAVHRLTETFSQLTPPVQGRLNEIREIMSPDSNYKNLRRRMSRAVGPCIPYLGVFLHDLVIACEIAPTFTEKGYVNFSKCCTLYNIMHEVLKHQGKEYKIKSNPRVQMMLANQYSISDEELYQKSLKLQPRAKRRQPTKLV